VLFSVKFSCEVVVIYLLELSAGSVLTTIVGVCSIISFIYYYLGRLAFLSLVESVLFKLVELLYDLLLLAGVFDEETMRLMGAKGLIGGVIIVYSYYFSFEY
jgi:hypothetical protein